jgi:tetrapyrrole methylase family protein/MazG family protein
MDKAVKKTLEAFEKAEEFGFTWPDHKMLLSAVQSELAEIDEVVLKKEPSERLREEIGDLLLGCIEICRYFSVSPKEALTHAEEKFTKRLEKLMEIAKREGKTHLAGESLNKKLSLWKQAKREVYAQQLDLQEKRES